VSKEGEPSDTLWIGFPPPSKVDEEGLRRAFLLFGEVERITTFPDRSYCFVQFRNVDEAMRAKDGLQGRLLNDPRILIRFSSNEGAPKRISKAEGTFYPQVIQRGLLAHPDISGPRTTRNTVDWPNSAVMHMANRYSAFQHDVNRPASLGYGRQTGGGGIISSMPDVHGAHFSKTELFSNNRISPLSVIEDHSNVREHKRTKVGSSSYSVGGLDDDLLRPAYSTLHSVRPGNVAETPIINWKGAIAKGGNVICRVQSFPVGKGVDGPL
jgi:RNA recognition motif-containing protein